MNRAFVKQERLMTHNGSMAGGMNPAKAGTRVVRRSARPMAVIPAQAAIRKLPEQPQERLSVCGKNNCRLSGAVILFLYLSMVFLLPFTTAGAGRIPSELIRRNARVKGTDLLVSAGALIAGFPNGGKTLFIDIRSAPDYEALHIPGAINIPLHFLKTKPQLKSIPLVLVDRGLALHRLEPACRDLGKKGFDVRILHGGMNGWSGADGPMVGDPVRRMGYCRISCADFFLEKDTPGHIVCDVSATRSAESVQLMPYAVHLPMAGSLGSRVARLEKFKAAHARIGTGAVLVVNDNGNGYRNYRSAFHRAGFANVFYLDGGVTAYAKYLEGLYLSWRPRSERVVTNRSCGECGERE